MAQLSCPNCGEDSQLRGERNSDSIQITCQMCRTTWVRPLTSRCATCGGDDIVTRPQTLVQFSRGTQLSIMGWRDIRLCGSCDAEALLRSTRAGAPLPHDYTSAAIEPP